jgi:chromate transporter
MGQRVVEVFLVALRLGLTSFGGPFAHLGYFHHEYVVRRRWVDEAAYADLVALCQFLPGPTSSQLGMALGRHRAGAWGAVAAWAGFTLPSALAMVALAAWWATVPQGLSGLVTGLEAAAFAVVAVAAWSMATKLSAGRRKAAITLAAAGVSALVLFPPGRRGPGGSGAAWPG